MEFLKTDIKNYKANRKIYMVISLHACDTATDQALALAVNNNVGSIVSVPCCQKEILSQYSFDTLDGILKHGILKAKLADILTDGVRSLILESLGYSVSIIEYISPLETPKNIMLRASKTSDINKKVLEESNTLKKFLNVSIITFALLDSEIIADVYMPSILFCEKLIAISITSNSST